MRYPCFAIVAGVLLAPTVPALGQEQEHEHHHHEAAPPAGHEGHAMPEGMTESEREHVPPDPPAQEIHDMPYEAMAEMMAMDDTHPNGRVSFDELEFRDAGNEDFLAWDTQAWYGGDYNKLWLKSEGDLVEGSADEVRTEALWDHVIGRWWSAQTGIRHDFGEGPSRTWAAFGVQGLAPYFFEVEATGYVGDGGRTAARFSGEYDLLLTQRLILQPEAEINLYGKSDAERGIGSGLSDLQFGLRLRYEIRREIAPYLGIVWTRRFGQSADLARDAGEDPNDLQVVAGLRIWF